MSEVNTFYTKILYNWFGGFSHTYTEYMVIEDLLNTYITNSFHAEWVRVVDNSRRKHQEAKKKNDAISHQYLTSRDINKIRKIIRIS